MRVSVVIPCHNGAGYIGRALESVAAQSRAPHDVIVIDDSSSDDLETVVRRAPMPVRLLHTRARNAAVARNVGIAAASGDWIAFLDADDIWYPNHLERAEHVLTGGGDVAFMANHDWVSATGTLVPIPDQHRCKLASPVSGMKAKQFFEVVLNGFHFGHSTVLYNKQRVIEVGMFNVEQVRRHDIELWLRVVADNTWAYDTVVSAAYTIDTPGSISRSALECDYYYLKALVLSEAAFAGPYFDRYLGKQARRAMGIAFTSGSVDHYQRVRDIALSRLPSHMAIMYRLAECVRPVASAALIVKRKAGEFARTAFGKQRSSE